MEQQTGLFSSQRHKELGVGGVGVPRWNIAVLVSRCNNFYFFLNNSCGIICANDFGKLLDSVFNAVVIGVAECAFHTSSPFLLFFFCPYAGSGFDSDFFYAVNIRLCAVCNPCCHVITFQKTNLPLASICVVSGRVNEGCAQ